jgi:hypothetical protein
MEHLPVRQTQKRQVVVHLAFSYVLHHSPELYSVVPVPKLSPIFDRAPCETVSDGHIFGNDRVSELDVFLSGQTLNS